MAKKDKKAKIPKRVGGIKVPKELRKAGSKLVKVAASPVGRELIAAGLGMVAAAASAAVEKDRARRRTASAAPTPTAPATPETPHKPAPPCPANSIDVDMHEVGAQLGKMAEQALAGLFKPKRS